MVKSLKRNSGTATVFPFVPHQPWTRHGSKLPRGVVEASRSLVSFHLILWVEVRKPILNSTVMPYPHGSLPGGLCVPPVAPFDSNLHGTSAARAEFCRISTDCALIEGKGL